MSKKPTVLMILDGYGLNDKVEGNAVAQAKTPVMDKLMAECPFVKGNASGLAVGLPDGQMGNSEVGHLNMGAGRIVYQELTRITKEIQEKTEVPCICSVCSLTAVYTATIHTCTHCLSWQKEKVWKMFMYIASWTDVTHRLHQAKAM